MFQQQPQQGYWASPITYIRCPSSKYNSNRCRSTYTNKCHNNTSNSTSLEVDMAGVALVAAVGVPTPCPQAWEMAISGEGQPYYIDHNTRTTHWELPQGYGPRRGIDSAKRKTKMCVNFEMGQCRWGDKCAFAHTAEELVAQPMQHEQAHMDGVPQQ